MLGKMITKLTDRIKQWADQSARRQQNKEFLSRKPVTAGSFRARRRDKKARRPSRRLLA